MRKKRKDNKYKKEGKGGGRGVIGYREGIDVKGAFTIYRNWRDWVHRT